MQPPKIDNSTKEEGVVYLLEAWKCLHNGEDISTAFDTLFYGRGRHLKVFALANNNSYATEVTSLH